MWDPMQGVVAMHPPGHTVACSQRRNLRLCPQELVSSKMIKNTAQTIREVIALLLESFMYTPARQVSYFPHKPGGWIGQQPMMGGEFENFSLMNGTH